MSDDSITTVEITITRVLTEDGEMAVRVGLPEEWSAVELLGLLDAARFHIYNQMQPGAL